MSALKRLFQIAAFATDEPAPKNEAEVADLCGSEQTAIPEPAELSSPTEKASSTRLDSDT